MNIILPRALYKYRYRPESISRKLYTMENLDKMMDENRNIVSMVNERRGAEIETIDRYFEDIVDLSLPFMDMEFSMIDTQKRIGYFTTSINDKKFGLIKELLFDQDVYLNKFDREYDWGFYYIKTLTDLVIIKNTLDKVFAKNPNCKVRVLVDKIDDELLKEKIQTELINFLLQKYYYYSSCFEFCLFTVGIPS